MPFGEADTRTGTGNMLDAKIELPTHEIACNVCTWVVVRCTRGPARPAISRLKYASALCSYCSRGRGKLHRSRPEAA